MKIEHSHCPDGCEHPQPFVAVLSKGAAEFHYLDPSKPYELCGRCFHLFGDITVMVPCTPATCPD